jgi:hypothetical protein
LGAENELIDVLAVAVGVGLDDDGAVGFTVANAVGVAAGVLLTDAIGVGVGCGSWRNAL